MSADDSTEHNISGSSSSQPLSFEALQHVPPAADEHDGSVIEEAANVDAAADDATSPAPAPRPAAAAIAAGVRRWAAPSTPHFERAADASQASDASQLDASSASAGAGGGESVVAAMAPLLEELAGQPRRGSVRAAVAALESPPPALPLDPIISPLPGRRLSAFMQDRVAAFTPQDEPPPELDPEHRGGPWSPPQQNSPELAPQEQPFKRGEHGAAAQPPEMDLSLAAAAEASMSAPAVETGVVPAATAIAGRHHRRASSRSARKSLDFSTGVPVVLIGGGEMHAPQQAVISSSTNYTLDTFEEQEEQKHPGAIAAIVGVEDSALAEADAQAGVGVDAGAVDADADVAEEEGEIGFNPFEPPAGAMSVITDQSVSALQQQHHRRSFGSRVSFGAMPGESDQPSSLLPSSPPDGAAAAAAGRDSLGDFGLQPDEQQQQQGSVVASMLSALNQPSFLDGEEEDIAGGAGVGGNDRVSLGAFDNGSSSPLRDNSMLMRHSDMPLSPVMENSHTPRSHATDSTRASAAPTPGSQANIASPFPPNLSPHSSASPTTPASTSSPPTHTTGVADGVTSPAPTTTTAAASVPEETPFSPNGYFAARSAPLGSLDRGVGSPSMQDGAAGHGQAAGHPHPPPHRPTFDTPEYVGGKATFLAAQAGDDGVFVSPRTIGPVLYRPTPSSSTFTSPVAGATGGTGRTIPVSSSSVGHDSMPPSSSPYSITVTPAQQAAAKPLASNGLWGAMGSPSPIQPSNGSATSSSAAGAAPSSSMRTAPTTPHDVRAITQGRLPLSAERGTPQSAATAGGSHAKPLHSSAPVYAITTPNQQQPHHQRTPHSASSLRSTPARTSLTSRFGPAVRTPVALPSAFGAADSDADAAAAAAADAEQSALFADNEDSLPSSPTDESRSLAVQRQQQSPQQPPPLPPQQQQAQKQEWRSSPLSSYSTHHRYATAPAPVIVPSPYSVRPLPPSFTPGRALTSPSSTAAALAAIAAARAADAPYARSYSGAVASSSSSSSTTTTLLQVDESVSSLRVGRLVSTVATLSVQRSPSLRKLHRFAMLDVDHALVKRRQAYAPIVVAASPGGGRRQPSTEFTLALDTVTALAEQYVRTAFPAATKHSSFSSASLSPRLHPLLSFHAVKAHRQQPSSRPNAFTLVLVFDAEGAAARAQLDTPEWMDAFADTMASIAARDKSKPVNAEQPPLAISFLELRPAHW